MATNGLLGILMANRAALLRYLALRGASTADAEDILQEMYLKLSTGGAGPVAEGRAYLYRMATNQWLDQRRAAGRRTRREEDWVDAGSGATREVDQAPPVDAVIAAREQLAHLQAAIDRLPERTRDIFRRFRIDGVPQRDIARDLGISVSAVEKHLTRAYAEIVTMRKKLDGEGLGSRRLSSDGGHHDA